jgi:putative glutamine amidotransferase
MKPLVGISCCSKSFGPNGLPNHAASDFCVRAMYEVADAVPVLLPAVGNDRDADCLLSRLDGILLTGSRSHIAPRHYGALQHDEAMPEDAARDATTLPLIRAAVARGTPILAICRGMQELNVALGGTLYQEVHKIPGRMDHRAGEGTREELFRIKHKVRLTGDMARISGSEEIDVNSLHGQGIDQLAPGLVVEATAPDGTIEAVRVEGAKTFAIAVQWHPEWEVTHFPDRQRLFAAFGEACAAYRDAR